MLACVYLVVTASTRQAWLAASFLSALISCSRNVHRPLQAASSRFNAMAHLLGAAERLVLRAFGCSLCVFCGAHSACRAGLAKALTKPAPVANADTGKAWWRLTSLVHHTRPSVCVGGTAPN
ncbi:hypothetical protein GQ54DRAFT_12016 [Martensiomyces pterosporus]|nr:hypothetical protein GQ54DRAFT_12016 [Martensiomyces pterosporus]